MLCHSIKLATAFVAMFRNILKTIFLISFFTEYANAIECGDDLRTMTKATDIHSLVLDEYLSLITCQRDHGNDTWEFYISKCLQNATCVGIQSNAPPSICTISNITHGELMPIDDLWLVKSKLDEYEGKLYSTN